MKDILIDTEALVLYIVGTINGEYLNTNRKHKKISVYSKHEFDIVVSLANSHRLIASPNVWTEVDNHLNDNLYGNERYLYFQMMDKLISNSIEKYIETRVVLNEYQKFTEIGITDSVILELAKNCECLISGDSTLSNLATSNGLKVVDLKAIVADRLRN